jgi:hypothetical protein
MNSGVKGLQTCNTLEHLSLRQSDDLKAIEDILPLVENMIREIKHEDEVKHIFKVVLKLVEKDTEWSTQVANSDVFVRVKSMLDVFKNSCDNKTFENLCLLVNAACYQNPLVKKKISELGMEQYIYDFLKHDSNKIYKCREYIKWKIPALKTLNNIQSWSSDFQYSDDYIKSLETLSRSFLSGRKICVTDPELATAVLMSIIKLLLTSSTVDNKHANTIIVLMNILLKLDNSPQTTTECLHCISMLAKRLSLLIRLTGEHTATFIDALTARCRHDAKLFIVLVVNVTSVLDCHKNTASKAGILDSDTVGVILDTFQQSKKTTALLKDTYRFIAVLAKNEYLTLIQMNEDSIFSILDEGMQTQDDTLILVDMYQSLMHMAKMSMSCNERISSIVFPKVLYTAKSVWQDRIVILRNIELIHSIMVSTDQSMMINEGLLIVLAKCLEVWRFDEVITEQILEILTGLALDQWDVKEEMKKLNFVHLIKALEVSSDTKHSDSLSALCVDVLKAITDYDEPMHASAVRELDAKDDVLSLPHDVEQFLMQGEILTVYTVDGRTKRMHVQTIQSHSRLVCKNINSIIAKDKYTMDIVNLTKVSKGYEKTGESKFEKGTSWFSQYPNPTTCFSLYALTTEKGPKEFNFCCKDSASRDQWVQSFITLVKHKKSSYKKGFELKCKSDFHSSKTSRF